MDKKIFKRLEILLSIALSTTVLILIGYEFLGDIIKRFLNAFLYEELISSIREYVDPSLILTCKEILKISIISIILVIIAKYIYYWRKRKKEKICDSDNKLYRSLYKYLEGSEKRGYVVTGYWGAGKTYNVSKFFEKYLKYRNREVYKISCFGLENRADIIKEMKIMFENQDKTLKSQVLKVIKVTPLIGEIIYNLLKCDYEIKDIKKNAIFMFDDFERIAARVEIIKGNEYYNNVYRKIYHYGEMNVNNSDNSNIYGSNSDLIQAEFKIVDSEVIKNQNGFEMQLKYRNLEKYNVITGLINELIEKYNMKVIILCNTETIDSEYFRLVFEGKLECIRYKLKPKDVLCEKLASNNIKSINSLSDDKKELLTKFFESNSKEIDEVWRNTKIENTRILSRIIVAFIDIIDEISIKLESNILKGIFYTIFIGNVCHYDNEIDGLNMLRIGENIISNDIKKDKREYMYLNLIKEKKELIWYGTNISLCWVTGIYNNNLEKFLDDIKLAKKYNRGLENVIANDIKEIDIIENELSNDSLVNIDDVLFLMFTMIKDYEKRYQIAILLFNNYHIDYSKITNKESSNGTVQTLRTIELFDKYELYYFLNKSDDIKEKLFKQMAEFVSFKDAEQMKKYVDFSESTKDLIESYCNWIKVKEIILENV